MAPSHVVLPASWTRDRVTSHIGSWWRVFSGQVALGLSFHKHKRRNLSVQLWRQCYINLWIQAVLFLIIAITATSAAVSWQFVGWILLIPPRLIISISTDYTVYSRYIVGVAVKSQHYVPCSSSRMIVGGFACVATNSACRQKSGMIFYQN